MTTEDLIASNTGLIYKIANDYFYGVEREDLFQAGAVGVLKAYENYKKDGTTKFSSYAYPFIFGEMYTLAMQKQIKISKDYLKLYKSIEMARYSLAQKWGFIPNNEQLALYLEKDINEIETAILAGSVMVSSLDKAGDEDRSLYDTIASEQVMSWDDQIAIQEGLAQLSEEERQIIKYRYFEDMTQSEVARKLKKTQVMVSRYEKKGIDKMREYYAA